MALLNFYTGILTAILEQGVFELSPTEENGALLMLTNLAHLRNNAGNCVGNDALSSPNNIKKQNHRIV